MNDPGVLQVFGTVVLVVIYSVMLWRAVRAMHPSRAVHDLIRLRRLLAFVVMWLTTLALFVGALGVVNVVPIIVSREVYAVLRVVMFIVGLSILLTWSPAGLTESPPEDELRLRRDRHERD